MKKPIKNYLRYQEITRKKRSKRNITSKNKAKIKRRRQSSGLNPTQLHPSNTLFIPGRKTVTCPPQLRLKYNDKSHCDRITIWIRTLILEATKQKIYLDFTKLIDCDLASVMLLTSEVRNIQIQLGHSSIRCSATGGNALITRVLKGSGLISLINNEKLFDWQHDKDMPIIHGDASEEKDFNTLTNYLLETYLPKNTSLDERARIENLIYKALSEAILNAEQHAYDEPTDTPPKAKRWWCATTISEGYFYLVLCDRGIGIPNHLPKSGLWEKIRQHVINDDAQMIHAAMTLTRTSRDSFIGGYGTKDIQDLVIESESGNLLLYSNRGVYRLDNVQGKIDVSSYKLGASIDGTIISWKLALPK